jgi:hypothetical protein
MRTRQQVLRSVRIRSAKDKKEEERKHRVGKNIPSTAIIEAKRIIRVEEDQEFFNVVITQKDRSTREMSNWEFQRNIPAKDLPIEADTRMMWMAAGSMDFTNLGFGPAIDMEQTFEHELHVEPGKGFIVKHGGVVFEDQVEPRKIVGFDTGFKVVQEGQVGVYRRLSPERAQVLGIAKEIPPTSLAS